jgi:uncharacterized membrane protein (Fun14 family)
MLISEVLPPVTYQLGLGGFGGFFVGYILKKVIKIAIVIGVFIFVLVYFAYRDVIGVNYDKLIDRLRVCGFCIGVPHAFAVQPAVYRQLYLRASARTQSRLR